MSAAFVTLALISLATASSTWQWPGAVARSDQSLRTGDRAQRLRAIAEVASAGGGRGAALRPLLGDPDRLVRRAAASALARLGDGAATTVAMRWLASAESEEQLAAIEVLRQAPQLPPGALAAAESALLTADDRLARSLFTLLEERGATPSLSALSLALSHQVAGVRLAATRLVGQHRQDGALPMLLARAEDEDRRVRVEAIRGLGRSGRSAAGPALLRALAGREEEVKLAGVEALGELRFAPAVQTLRQLASAPGPDRLARAAVLALGEIGTPDAVAALSHLLAGSPFPSDVRAGLMAAGAGAIPAIEGRLGQDEALATRECAALLADLRAVRAVPSLVRVATRVHPAALAAIRALGDLMAHQAVPALVHLAQDPSPAVRTAALEALTTIGDAQAMGAAERSLADEHPGVRVAALALSAGLRVPSHGVRVAAALDDQHPRVRRAALKALPHFGRLASTDVRRIVAARERFPGDESLLGAALEAAASGPQLAELAAVYLSEAGPVRHALRRGLAAAARSGVDAPALPSRLRARLIDGLLADLSVTDAPEAVDVLLSPVCGDAARAIAGRAPSLPPSVRAQLAPALRTTASGRRLLLAAVTDATAPAVERAAAAWALVGSGDSEAREALRQATRDGHPAVAANASAALATTPGAEVGRFRLQNARASRGWLTIRLASGDHVWVPLQADGTARVDQMPAAATLGALH